MSYAAFAPIGFDNALKPGGAAVTSGSHLPANQPVARARLAAYQVPRDPQGKSLAGAQLLQQPTSYKSGEPNDFQLVMLLLTGFALGVIALYLFNRFVASRAPGRRQAFAPNSARTEPDAKTHDSAGDQAPPNPTPVANTFVDPRASESMPEDEGRHLSLISDAIPTALWTADAQLQVISARGAGLNAVGLRAQEAVGMSLTDFFGTHDPEFPAVAAHRKALAGDTAAFETSWAGRRFEARVEPLLSDDGAIRGVIGVALDVTERERLANELRQSQKMRAVGELAGGVAHDFNNLLMVVKTHAQLLIEGLSGSSSLRQSAEQVEKAADCAASLTRQLLAFSRDQAMRPCVLDLNELIAGMIKMFSRVMGENIEMAFLPGANLGRVKADAGQIGQVLLNLVVNARDAMPNGGRLTIETANVVLDRGYAARHAPVEAGPYVMLTVADTGCGMNAETQSRIFEPFFTTKPPGKGTGLGLATVYGVLKQSGGHIWFYSEPDHGTTFKIYLPEVPVQNERSSTNGNGKRALRATETVLLAEDEPSVREVVRDYLRRAGYRVIEATDGRAAVKAASAHPGPIHLLITDVTMPHLKGPELAARLKLERPELKVLYVSGSASDPALEEAIPQENAAVLQKPFSMSVLAERIREVLDGQGAHAMAQSNLHQA